MTPTSPHPGDAAREMETVLRAPHFAGQLITSIDRAQGALNLDDPARYSALTTLIQHAQEAAERIQTLLRQLSA